MHSGYYSTNDTKGFTLIEILVAIALSGIVLVVLGQFFISTNKTYSIQEKVAGNQQGIRAAMEMMTRDIRMAGLDPAGSAGDAGFRDNGNDDDDTDANSIAIAYDYFDDSTPPNPESDGDCNDDGEYICYSFDSANERIMWKVSNDGGTSWQVGSLTPDGTIASMDFEYTLADGTTAADPSGSLGDIRTVTITICGQISGAYADSSEGLNAEHCFSNIVKCRNM